MASQTTRAPIDPERERRRAAESKRRLRAWRREQGLKRLDLYLHVKEIARLREAFALDDKACLPAALESYIKKLIR